MAWLDLIVPIARRVSAATGVPVSTVIAQTSNETGNGTSNLAVNHHNLAGITYTSHADYRADGGRFAGYYSVAAWEADYIRVLNLSFYDAARVADGIDAARALGESPYDEDGYTYGSYPPGQKLVDQIEANGLLAYDAPAVAEAPADPFIPLQMGGGKGYVMVLAAAIVGAGMLAALKGFKT